MSASLEQGALGASLDLRDLHAANIARQAEWCPDQVPDLSFRGNELGGECGEAQNVIKKLERERQGWRGSRATKEDLADELADVVICADLCAVTADIDLGAAVRRKFNTTSDKQGLSIRLAEPASAPASGAERMTAGEVDWRKVMRDLLREHDKHICLHEETHRGGVIWTICDHCGRKWADDEGGFQPYEEPAAVTAAWAALKCEEIATPAPATPPGVPLADGSQVVAHLGPHFHAQPRAGGDANWASWSRLHNIYTTNPARCTDGGRILVGTLSQEAVLAWQSASPGMPGVPDSVREAEEPRIFKDGDAWCCLLGDNIQDGIAGFGNTPDAARRNFRERLSGNLCSVLRGALRVADDTLREIARDVRGADWLLEQEEEGRGALAVIKAALAARPAAPEAQGAWRSRAADDVLAERHRQVEVEGWTPKHDDTHSRGEMACAAACYATGSDLWTGHEQTDRKGRPTLIGAARVWPWSGWWKPADRRHNLVKAGALILAEIERLDRLPAPPSSSGQEG